jgi:ribonuclease P protein component
VFTAVLRTGRPFRTPLLTVYVATRAGGPPRLGVAAGKRYSPLAVKRNRVKRLLREAFRLNRGRLPDADVVVVPRPGADAAGLATLAEELVAAVNRAAGPEGTR